MARENTQQVEQSMESLVHRSDMRMCIRLYTTAVPAEIGFDRVVDFVSSQPSTLVSYLVCMDASPTHVEIEVCASTLILAKHARIAPLLWNKQS